MLDRLESLLISNGLSSTHTTKVVANIEVSLSSMLFAYREVSDLAFYLVLQNSGKCKWFKTIKGVIVKDKLDEGYQNSRELIGLDDWDVKSIFKINFSKDSFNIERVSKRKLQKLLFSVVEPSVIKYVIGVDGVATLISVDNDELKGLHYNDFKSCILDTYNRKIEGISKGLSDLPSCCVVDFA